MQVQESYQCPYVEWVRNSLLWLMSLVCFEDFLLSHDIVNVSRCITLLSKIGGVDKGRAILKNKSRHHTLSFLFCLFHGHSVFIQSLRAFDITKNLGYITTLAYISLPWDPATLFISHLHNLNTELYRNSNSSIKTLMFFINSKISFVADRPISQLCSESFQVFVRVFIVVHLYTSLPNLSSNQKISIGVVFPLAVLALFWLETFWWQRRRHNINLQSLTEKDVDETPYEIAAKAKQFDLQEREHDLKKFTIEENRRNRQKLHAGDFLQEIASSIWSAGSSRDTTLRRGQSVYLDDALKYVVLEDSERAPGSILLYFLLRNKNCLKVRLGLARVFSDARNQSFFPRIRDVQTSLGSEAKSFLTTIVQRLCLV